MNKLPWWKTAVFYQIYPRSFADGNGDGFGDLPGMISRLDYLQSLGVDAIWLSPHYPSPFVDCGYDVSDYCAVDPIYGTMQHFRHFLDGLHARGMHLILDLVLNHTSHEHIWFQESRASKTNPKRDWYIWKKGRAGLPPNDWYSTFGGSAWELEKQTGEYYYHYFFKEQPDLNWHNPQVKEAMFNIARFWLDMGVDGFRLDAIGTIFEEEGWPDQKQPFSLDDLFIENRLAQNPGENERVKKRWMAMFHHQFDQPGIHALMRELRQVVDEYPDRVLVGETDDLSYYGNGDDELNLVFNFPLMYTEKLTPAHVRKNQQERLLAIPQGGWPCNTLGNHDSPRVFTRFGDEKHGAEMARLNLALLLTLKGTPFLYNGEEIGMTDLLITDPTRFRDPLSTRTMEMEKRLLGADDEHATLAGAREGRDKGRSPMQWRNTINAGFCPPGVEPWLPVNPNYAEGVNVEEEDHDPDSLLSFYRAALKARRFSPALQSGDYQLLLEDNPFILAFERECDSQDVFVLLNFSEDSQTLASPAIQGKVVLGTHRSVGDRVHAGGVSLEPFEAVVIDKQDHPRQNVLQPK